MMLQAELSLPRVCAWNRQGWMSLPGALQPSWQVWGGDTQPLGAGTLWVSATLQLTVTAMPGPLPGSKVLWCQPEICEGREQPALHYLGKWGNRCDRHSTGHGAPPACSWPEGQPDSPALISREQAAALKLSKTGVEKNILPRKREALPWSPVWMVGAESAVPRGSSLCGWSPCTEQPRRVPRCHVAHLPVPVPVHQACWSWTSHQRAWQPRVA